MSVSGFALRINGTCETDGVDCGVTVAPYHACCPKSTFCPHAYNVDCCPSAKNCTSTLLQDPQCADRTWDLYANDGFFCCKKGFVGYASTTKSDGCAKPGYAFQKGETLLSIISAGQVESSTTSSSASPTSSSALAATTTAAASDTPTSNTGAIVGGVLGALFVVIPGLVAAWLIYRRRHHPKGTRGQPAKVSESDTLHEIDGYESKRGQLEEQHGLSELENGEVAYGSKKSREPAAVQLADQHGHSELPA